jgi:predicted AAA+ superfamily ATPase
MSAPCRWREIIGALAIKLLEEVTISLGSPFKWSGVANAMDVANPRTAREYVEYLAEAFLLLMVYHWDLSGSLSPQRQRKVYFIDPLLSQIAPALNDGVRHAPEDGVVENLVAVGLFRSAVHTLVQADAVPGSVAYWRSTNDRELDFLVPSRREKGHARLPIEVKGDADAQIAAAARAIKAAFGEGIVVTRTKFNIEDTAVTRIPAPIFLAALKENVQRDNPLV